MNKKREKIKWAKHITRTRALEIGKIEGIREASKVLSEYISIYDECVAFMLEDLIKLKTKRP